MPAVLLPLTAAPFAPRAPPTVVLDTTVNPWLTQTLKRVNRLKRPLNSVPQHTKCLTELLSGPNAIWNLCSILVPRAPESEIEGHSNPVSDALLRYQFIHIQSYIVSIDMVMSNEVAYKLTPETISSLVEYHKDIYMVDQADATWQWTEKEAAVKTMHEEFVQAVNKFVFRTDKVALEGIEDDGSGELLCGQSEEVRSGIMGMFLPLLPPPPRIVEVRAPITPTIPSSPASANWWAPTPPINSQIAPVDSWKVLPSNNPPVLHSNAPAVTSSPSPMSMTTADSLPSTWSLVDLQDDGEFEIDHEMMVASSMAEATSVGHTAAMTASSSWWNAPPSPPSPHHLHPLLASTSGMIPQLPLPSGLGPSCGTSMGFGSFGWEAGRYADFATTM